MKGWNSDSIEIFKQRGMIPDNKPCTIVPENIQLLKKVKRHPRHEESDLQMNCVKTFRLMYPKLKLRLYAIPNGGKRDAREAERLIKEGVLPGALDLFLSKPNKAFSGMYIEVKTKTGRLSDYQIQFIKEMREDYYCCVIRSVEEFLREVNGYLENS